MTDLITKTRDEVIADYERDYMSRVTDGLAGPNTQVRLDAILIADQLMPIYGNTINAARKIDLEQRTLTELQSEAEDLGVALQGATGSTGYVTISAATGGTTIFAGDELTEPTTRLVFYCLTTALYANGDDVPVSARSTGPATNLDAATVLQWSSPRAGCATTCTVAIQTDGSGLSGGHDAEGREQIIEAIRDARANPPGAGNDADYHRWIRGTPGVQIEQSFVYPCAMGPGTVGWNFTVAPDKYGSRIPTALQIALVRQNLALAPGTDLQFHLTLAEQSIPVVATVTWSQDADQWADAAPWPGYFELTPGAGSGAVLVSTGTTPLVFTLATSNGDYTTCGDPVAGQTLGFWDSANRAFVHKRITSVTGGGPWDIVCDGTFGASDNVYVPVAGQRAMPWSESLATLVAPVAAHFDGVGPGEAKALGYLDGQRARRDPASPKRWPDRTTKALETSMESLDAVESLDLVEGGGIIATVALTPYVLTLDELSAFPA